MIAPEASLEWGNKTKRKNEANMIIRPPRYKTRIGFREIFTIWFVKEITAAVAAYAMVISEKKM